MLFPSSVTQKNGRRRRPAASFPGRLAMPFRAPRALGTKAEDAMLRFARKHARRVLTDVNALACDHLLPEQQAWLNEAQRRIEVMLRLTDAEGIAAIADAVLHTDQKLTLEQIIAALLPPD